MISIFLLEWYKFGENSDNYYAFKNLLINKYAIIEQRESLKRELNMVENFSSGLDLIMDHFKSLSIDDAILLNVVLCKDENLSAYVEESKIYKISGINHK